MAKKTKIGIEFAIKVMESCLLNNDATQKGVYYHIKRGTRKLLEDIINCNILPDPYITSNNNQEVFNGYFFALDKIIDFDIVDIQLSYKERGKDSFIYDLTTQDLIDYSYEYNRKYADKYKEEIERLNKELFKELDSLFIDISIDKYVPESFSNLHLKNLDYGALAMLKLTKALSNKNNSPDDFIDIVNENIVETSAFTNICNDEYHKDFLLGYFAMLSEIIGTKLKVSIFKKFTGGVNTLFIADLDNITGEIWDNLGDDTRKKFVDWNYTKRNVHTYSPDYHTYSLSYVVQEENEPEKA